ncbi:hypothetical protein N7457_005999 [Penicillium paradoxum]|uniref:uncharacterized protein n=1 Tax=Penicillium paradoxum TaxID=176176 RepID=UPI0025473058|nr:uncharacterized protein N7457_005999 [Penicillium paradoxum]KAJ5780839.1 hypothetical protein N7457_005999 [Penicillium paradoxum]
MESVPNYNSIIHSSPFTFLVGPRHTKLTIQSGLAEHVSKPLDNLMNGPTRESKHRIAVLEEEDVETFVAFCEYAYTGDYSVPRPEPEAQEEPRVGVVESAPNSATWRAHYRAGSISSVVPPPAPSPPPQHRHRGDDATYHQLQPEPSMSQPGEHFAFEVAKEPEAPTDAVEHEVETAPEPEVPASAPEPELEPEIYQDAEGTPEAPAPVEEAPPADEQWANSTQQPASWEPEEPKANKKKGKKGKKGKKSNLQPEFVEEQVPAPVEPVNLTPPSTPPPEFAAVPLPEPAAESADPWDTPTEPAPEPESTQYYEQPIEEPTPMTEEPSPAAEEPAPVEEQPAVVVEEPKEELWTQDRTEDNDVTPGQLQRPMLDMSFAQQQASSPCEPGLNLWDEFLSLQYNDEPAVSKPSRVDTGSTDLPYITFHAKVYVFATRYLIPALAQLCLRKLHRDLLILAMPDGESIGPSESQILDGLAASKAQMVLELLQYTYTKTARLEPITPTSATQLRDNELRRLVVHYTACKVKELARYHSADDSITVTPPLQPVDLKVERVETPAPRNLRSLLDVTTELASDLVYRLM